MLEHAPEVLLLNGAYCLQNRLKLDRFFYGYDQVPKPRKIIIDLQQRSGKWRLSVIFADMLGIFFNKIFPLSFW